MSYVLDGIKTAMELDVTGVRCPCGFLTFTWADLNAARFHYTHCPQAKMGAPLNTRSILPERSHMIP